MRKARHALTWRATGIDARRTHVFLVATGLAVLGMSLTIAKQPPFNHYTVWSSSWAGGGLWLSQMSIVLGPVAGAVAAWVGGRERRRGMVELLAGTPRRRLQRVTTTWVVVTGGLVLGMVAVSALVGIAIAPTVSYSGGRWWASWLIVFLGIVVCSAAGFAAGRLVKGRLVAPAVGIVLYVANGFAVYSNHAWAQLAPVGNLPVNEGRQLIGWVIGADLVWLLALTVTALFLASGHRRRAMVTALVAVVVALPLGQVPGANARTSWTEADAGASAPVCTNGSPHVCLTRVHAGLLPEAAPAVRRVLANARRVLPVDRASEVPYGSSIPPRTLVIPDLDGESRFLQPGMRRRADLAMDIGYATASPPPKCEGKLDADNSAAWVAVDVAASLIAGHRNRPMDTSTQFTRTYQSLAADPVKSRAWMRAYMHATRRCDVQALTALGSVVR